MNYYWGVKGCRNNYVDPYQLCRKSRPPKIVSSVLWLVPVPNRGRPLAPRGYAVGYRIAKVQEERSTVSHRSLWNFKFSAQWIMETLVDERPYNKDEWGKKNGATVETTGSKVGLHWPHDFNNYSFITWRLVQESNFIIEICKLKRLLVREPSSSSKLSSQTSSTAMAQELPVQPSSQTQVQEDWWDWHCPWFPHSSGQPSALKRN